MKAQERGVDIILAVSLYLFSILMFIGIADIPPPFFDPLGSAAVPKGCAVLVAVFATIILIKALRTKVREKDGLPPEFEKKPLLGLGIVLCCVGYVALLTFIPFNWATSIYVIGSGLLLGGVGRKNIVLSVLMALILGFGGQYLFVKVFFIDLPT